MNLELLNIENQEFINNNLNSDIPKLILKGVTSETISIHEFIEQIEAKKKCQKKLPIWYETKNIYYPNKLNIEQTSSEITAEYKSNLISGAALIDLTGGFGVDAFYFAKQFKNVIHCEIDKELSTIVSHNYKQLGLSNIETINQNGIEYLQLSNKVFDWIYIDPSRRHDSKGKVFYLNDCLPNVPKYLEVLFQHSKNILVKASPMLDLSIGISELQYVKTIHIIAINNEVKEVLFHLEVDYTSDIYINTTNLTSNGHQLFEFLLHEEEKASSSYDTVSNYLYEPNSAILKSGAFHLISSTLNISKLHQHTHLYTSDALIDFPGRRFKVIDVIPYNKKTIQHAIGNTKVNISTRNFPESPQQLKAKFKLKDGGDHYVFFITQGDREKVVLVCKKME